MTAKDRKTIAWLLWALATVVLFGTHHELWGVLMLVAAAVAVSP
jgi:hypothetical protein